MNKSAIVKIIVWSIVAVLSLTVLIFGILDDTSSFGFISAYYENEDDYTIVHGREEIYDEISNININWMNGTVSIDTHGEDYIIISEHGATDENSRMRILARGGTLTVQARKSARFIFDNPEEKTLVVLIPQSMAEGLGKLSVESLSGNIKIANIKSEFLSLESADAEIEISNVEARHIDAETVNADAHISGAFDNADIESVSGNVILESSICPNLTSDFVSGNFKIYVPQESSFAVTFDKVSGHFSTDFEFTKRMGEYVVNGGGKEFELETVSGNVFIGKLSK